MIKKINEFRKSIFFRIVIPMVLLTVIQSIIVILVLNFTVIKNSVEKSQIQNFKSQVSVRKNYIENLISNSWNNFENFDNNINTASKKFLNDNSLSVEEMLTDSSKSEDYLNELSPYLIQLLNDNQVNDAYFILNNDFDDKLLTYIRTKNPKNTSNSEIDVIYAPRKVWQNFYKQKFGLSMTIDTNKFTDIEDRSFFTQPIQAYKDNVDQERLGYWECNAYINSTDVLTQSRVLVINDQIVGVYGIGVTSIYLDNLFYNLNKGEEINVALVKKQNGTSIDSLASYLDLSLPKIENISFAQTEYEDIYEFFNEKTSEYYCEYNLNIYNGSNIYDDLWYLVGIRQKNKILKIAKDTKFNILMIYGISFLIVVILSCVIAYIVTRPIVKVSNNISERNINKIPNTNITEVDNLISEINYYFKKTTSLSNKMNRLIEDSTFNISFFEYQREKDSISATKQFYEMLNLPYKEDEITSAEFLFLFKCLKEKIISSTYTVLGDNILKESGEIIFCIDKKYLRLKIDIDKNYDVFATLIDFTKDYLEKQRLEKERDYDVLTGLLNRRGFYSKVLPLFNSPTSSNCSYFMIDVDNLKRINDIYGHEFGDGYLQQIGNYLLEITKKHENLYVCHISGDEYVLYLDGFKSLQEENEIIHAIEKIRSEFIYIKTKKFYISFSMGICRNIKGISFEEVRKRADYSMYIAKRNGKNLTQVFDDEIYNLYVQETILLEDLNKLISQRLFDYAYQPIVDIRNGEILGYEALLRPMLKDYNPGMVINAAKKYNRLYDIEKITMFCATEKFFKKQTGKKIFLNSISSQVFNDDDLHSFKEAFKENFDSMVIELIEEDFGQNTIIKRKTNFLDENNIQYAIDDYGTGFNNIGMILSFHPVYIKIEGSLIRGIDKDDKKQKLAKSIVSYCSVNKIKIVAEAVETVEELKFVKELGVDYVQGYLLAKPDLEIKELSQDKIDLLKNI